MRRSEAGIPAENITSWRLTVDYIEPGLDAMVAEDAYDLRFANPFGLWRYTR